VVRERHDDVRPEQLLEAMQDGWEPDELHKHGIAADGLSQAADRPAAFSVE
jgi:hypothetical protein